MPRKKPSPRPIVQRSRENPNRRLSATIPSVQSREELSTRVQYVAYPKHKLNPTAFNLPHYAGEDNERTYCDAHANFGKKDVGRIPKLLKRGVMLGLWSQRTSDDVPPMLWTIDDNGRIFELRISNAVQAQYHGYPLLSQDAFARHVMVRARNVVDTVGEFTEDEATELKAAISAAESLYQ